MSDPKPGSDEPELVQEDDYDLLTQYEASRRLTENIAEARLRSVDSDESASEAHRRRLDDLERAAKRHREYRPADRPTFFSESGRVERVDTTKRK
jgi:hypothetical protein